MVLTSLLLGGVVLSFQSLVLTLTLQTCKHRRRPQRPALSLSEKPMPTMSRPLLGGSLACLSS